MSQRLFEPRQVGAEDDRAALRERHGGTPRGGAPPRDPPQFGPNLIEAWYELGRARWFAGDPDGAKQAWSDGHKANKFNPWGKRCKEMLDLVAKGEEPPRTGTPA